MKKHQTVDDSSSTSLLFLPNSILRTDSVKLLEAIQWNLLELCILRSMSWIEVVCGMSSKTLAVLNLTFYPCKHTTQSPIVYYLVSELDRQGFFCGFWSLAREHIWKERLENQEIYRNWRGGSGGHSLIDTKSLLRTLRIHRIFTDPSSQTLGLGWSARTIH